MAASPVVPAVLTILCALHSTAAELRWLRIRSANFELFTAASERDGRDAILHFEWGRSFFLKMSQTVPDSRLPVRIVAFRSGIGYARYRAGDLAAAYATGDENRDYIVMSSLGTRYYPVAVHEYVHLLQRAGRNKLPLWLAEGMADLYSTLKPVGKGVEVGRAPPGRYGILRSSKWIDLETLTSVDQKSPHYNKSDFAYVFYAESWALTHMLAMTEPYRPKFAEFLAALAEGSHAAAFERAYGKTMAEVWSDLGRYMRRGKFNTGVFDVQLEKTAEEPEIVEVDAVERGMVLASLLGMLRRWPDAEQAFEQLAREHPGRADVEEAFGYAALKCRQNEAAAAHFARAAKLGSTNARFYYDYANLLRANGKTGLPELRKAVELEPGFVKARLRLGLTLMSERDYEGALEHLRRLTDVDPQDAFLLYSSLAQAYQSTGNRQETLKALARAKEVAKNAHETESVNRLSEYLERSPGAGAGAVSGERPGAPEEASAQTGPPELTRSAAAGKPPAPAASPEPPPLPSLEGTLDQVDCLGRKARLRLRSQGRPVVLVIVDPSMVQVQGTGGAPVEFACGPQRSRHVKITYEPKADAEPGAIGIVRKIEFIRE